MDYSADLTASTWEEFYGVETANIFDGVLDSIPALCSTILSEFNPDNYESAHKELDTLKAVQLSDNSTAKMSSSLLRTTSEESADCSNIEEESMQSPRDQLMKLDYQGRHVNNFMNAECFSSRNTSDSSGFHSMPEEPNDSERYVQRILKELVDTEQAYVRDLDDIVVHYLPLMSTLLDAADLSIIFGNLVEIVSFSRLFCAKIESCDKDVFRIGCCFLDNLQGFDIYASYCTNYPNAVKLLSVCMKRPGALSEKLSGCQQTLNHNLPLIAYLLKPVQRILKYHLLLQNMVKYCMAGSKEHECIVEAARSMRDISKRINEIKRRHEKTIRVQELQMTLSSAVLEQLGELIMEGPIRESKRLREAFLFESAFILAKRKQDGQLSCKYVIKCENLILCQRVSQNPGSFILSDAKRPNCQLYLQASSAMQKQQWCSELEKLIGASEAEFIKFRSRTSSDSDSVDYFSLTDQSECDTPSKPSLRRQESLPSFRSRAVRKSVAALVPDFSNSKKASDGSTPSSRRRKLSNPESRLYTTKLPTEKTRSSVGAKSYLGSSMEDLAGLTRAAGMKLTKMFPAANIFGTIRRRRKNKNSETSSIPRSPSSGKCSDFNSDSEADAQSVDYNDESPLCDVIVKDGRSFIVSSETPGAKDHVSNDDDVYESFDEIAEKPKNLRNVEADNCSSGGSGIYDNFPGENLSVDTSTDHVYCDFIEYNKKLAERLRRKPFPNCEKNPDKSRYNSTHENSPMQHFAERQKSNSKQSMWSDLFELQSQRRRISRKYSGPNDELLLKVCPSLEKYRPQPCEFSLDSVPIAEFDCDLDECDSEIRVKPDTGLGLRKQTSLPTTDTYLRKTVGTGGLHSQTLARKQLPKLNGVIDALSVLDRIDNEFRNFEIENRSMTSNKSTVDKVEKKFHKPHSTPQLHSVENQIPNNPPAEHQMPKDLSVENMPSHSKTIEPSVLERNSDSQVSKPKKFVSHWSASETKNSKSSLIPVPASSPEHSVMNKSSESTNQKPPIRPKPVIRSCKTFVLNSGDAAKVPKPTYNATQDSDAKEVSRTTMHLYGDSLQLSKSAPETSHPDNSENGILPQSFLPFRNDRVKPSACKTFQRDSLSPRSISHDQDEIRTANYQISHPGRPTFDSESFSQSCLINTISPPKQQAISRGYVKQLASRFQNNTNLKY